MFQQNRVIQLSLVGALMLVALLGMFLVGRRRSSKPATKVVGHKVETPAEDVQKYWTAKRMRNTKPAPMPHLTDAGKRKQPENPHKPQA